MAPTVDAKADASAQAKQERKLAKKARKAAGKVQEVQAKGDVKNDHEAAKPDVDSAASGKKEKNKKDRELQKQVLELEKKRHHHLAESKKLEAQVQQLLKQADNADKVAKWVAKALEEISEDGAGDDDVSDAESSGGKNPDTVMKDAVDAPKATSEKTNGEKKKKKKEKKKVEETEEVEEVEEAPEKKKSKETKETSKKKKKSKSKPEETTAFEGQAAKAKAETSDGKRKRQDDNAEQPVSKKAKKAKESKGGEQEAHAAAEEVKIEGLEGGKARQDKFLRLLGGKKAGVSAAKPGVALKNQGKSVRAEAAIQEQFEAGMALKESGQKRRGLGA